jgi:hypothetical protein
MDTATNATHPEAIPATADLPSRSVFSSPSTSCKDTTEIPVTLVKPELVSATTSEPSLTLRESCSAKLIDDEDEEDCGKPSALECTPRLCVSALRNARGPGRRRRVTWGTTRVQVRVRRDRWGNQNRDDAARRVFKKKQETHHLYCLHVRVLKNASDSRKSTTIAGGCRVVVSFRVASRRVRRHTRSENGANLSFRRCANAKRTRHRR